MQTTQQNSITGKALILLLWAISCLSVFIYFPGRISYIYWSNLQDLPFIAEKLGRVDLADYFASLFLSFAGVTIFSLACISLGMFITKHARINNIFDSTTFLSKLALAATQFVLGHGILSLVFLTLGGAYKLTPLAVSVVLAVGLLSGLGQLKNSIRWIFTSRKLEDRSNRALFWLSCAIFLLAILQSSARISYDSSSIYFSDAKLTALAQHIVFFTNDTFVASVFQTAIQYSAIIQLFGDQSARMFSWVCGLAIIVFSLALGERVGISRQGRLILLVLLVTSTAFLDLLGDGKADIISSAPAIAAVYWMTVQSQNIAPRKFLLFLTGFLIGLAVIARPFNAFLLGIFTLLFYFQKTVLKNGFKLSNLNNFISALFWIGVGAIGPGLYHLFANWIILGDPLAFMSTFSTISPTTGPWDFDPDHLLAIRLLYLVIVTFKNTPQSLGNVSPMLMALWPILLIKEIRKQIKISSELLGLLAVAVITLLLWIFSLFTVSEIRYVFFLWIILFLPFAETIAIALANENSLLKNTVRGSTVVLLVFILLRTVYISMDAYSPLDQEGNPQCYDQIFCEYLKPINRAASLGDRVLTLGAYRYYLRTDLFACSTTHEEYRILQELSYKDTDAFWTEAYLQGYKYIAYENDYAIRHLQFGLIPSPENAPAWIQLEPIYGNPEDDVVAYKINVHQPPISKLTMCTQNALGIWEVQEIK